MCTSTTGGEVYDRGTYRHWDIISMHKAIKSDGEDLSPLCIKGNRNESDGLPGCTSTKKKGNDVNKCTFIVYRNT